MNIVVRLISLIMLFLTCQAGIATTSEFTEQQYDVSHFAQGEEIYGYDNNSNLRHCCQALSDANFQDRSFFALVGDFSPQREHRTKIPWIMWARHTFTELKARTEITKLEKAHRNQGA